MCDSNEFARRQRAGKLTLQTEKRQRTTFQHEDRPRLLRRLVYLGGWCGVDLLVQQITLEARKVIEMRIRRGRYMRSNRARKLQPTPSEAVQEPSTKPALGRSHDAYATFYVALAFAGLLFFLGRARVESDWVGWTGCAITFLALIAAVYYFRRAYGFSSQGIDELPRGAVASTFMCLIFAMQYIPAALYAQYFEESLFGYAVSCLTLAVVVVGPLRAALGKAPHG